MDDYKYRQATRIHINSIESEMTVALMRQRLEESAHPIAEAAETVGALCDVIRELRLRAQRAEEARDRLARVIADRL